MCCSGHGGSITAALQLQAAALPAPPAREKTARLRYLGKTAMSLRGPFSGVVYELTASQAEIPVDPNDQAALLRTGLFEAP